jgi:hypothetical protein
VAEKLNVLVLVKAAPVLTSQLEETMCVAGMTVDDAPRWVRLHPVPFRDLDVESQFHKYQELSVDVIRSRTDRRPESWTPIEGSEQLGRTVGTKNGWAERRRRIGLLGEPTMCSLVRANQTGSRLGTPSLGVVRLAAPPKLVITPRDEIQLRSWTMRAEAIAARQSLFDDPSKPKIPFEVVPWRFRYHYRCLDDSCNGHEQTIVDWEALALYRHVSNHPDWQDRMRAKLVGEMFGPGRDSVLFVGNQEQHPQSFLVLGIFWPPTDNGQMSLL